MNSINQIGVTPIPQTGTKNTTAIQKKYSNADAPQFTSLLGKDEASLSESAKALAKAYQSLGEIPDVRTELIDSLRQQIDGGEYSIPYDKLAGVLAKRLYRT